MSGEQLSKTPDDIAGALNTIRSHRAAPQPFEVAVIGYSDQANPSAYGDAGASW